MNARCMTASEFRAQFGRTTEPFGKKRNKYNAKRTAAPDGSRTYDSKAEAAYCEQLRVLERSGIISELVLKPKYPIVIGGDLICTVVPEARFRDETGKIRIVDKKGGRATQTKEWHLKRKLFASIYRGLEIEVV